MQLCAHRELSHPDGSPGGSPQRPRQSDAHHWVCHVPTKGLWPTAAKADWHWLLGDERELGHPVAGSLSWTSVHESSRTESFVCLFPRCIVWEPTQRLWLSTAASVNVSSRQKTGFCLWELPLMCGQDRAMERRLSPRRHCSGGSVSVTLVVEFASLVPQDDMPLPFLPSSNWTHSLSRLFQQPRRACPSSWSLAPLSHGWLQKRCPRGSMPSVEGLRPPCSRCETEVVVPRRQFSTVPDVEKHVLGILRILCTKADSGNASSCADPVRSDQECPDLWASLDEMASVLSHLPALVGQSASITLERHRYSHQLSPGVPSASLWRRTNYLPWATVFGRCVWNYVRVEKRTCVSSMITQIPLLSETTKKEGVFEHRTHEQALGLFLLLEVGILPDVLHHAGDELHSPCEFQGQAMVFFCPGYSIDRHGAAHTRCCALRCRFHRRNWPFLLSR